jgi:hypothetical protein
MAIRRSEPESSGAGDLRPGGPGYNVPVALLSSMMRTVAITGRTDTVNAWFADRQGGRWAEQTVRSAFPGMAPGERGRVRADPAEALRELTELRRTGAVTDAEYDALRARLGV